MAEGYDNCMSFVTLQCVCVCRSAHMLQAFLFFIGHAQVSEGMKKKKYIEYYQSCF